MTKDKEEGPRTLKKKRIKTERDLYSREEDAKEEFPGDILCINKRYLLSDIVHDLRGDDLKERSP